MSAAGQGIESAGAASPVEVLKSEFLLLRSEDVRVFLFGSRTRGDFQNTSAVDSGIIAGEGFDRARLALLRERIEEMNVPYKVEVVDFSDVSEAFREAALREAVLWKG